MQALSRHTNPLQHTPATSKPAKYQVCVQTGSKAGQRLRRHGERKLAAAPAPGNKNAATPYWKATTQVG